MEAAGFAFSFWAVTAYGTAEDIRSTDSAVRSANRALFEATLRRDGEALARAMDDRLLWIDPDGTVDMKMERLGALASGKVRFDTLAVDEEAARCFAGACTVTGRYLYTQDGLAAAIRFLRVFVKREGVWVLLLHHATRIGEPHESFWAPASEAASSTLPPLVTGVEAEVVRAYQLFTEAVATNDVAALDRIYADDYRFQNWRGGIGDKRQQVGAAQTGLIHHTAAVVDEIHVRVLGELAVVSGRRSQHGQGSIGPRPGLVRHTAVFLKRAGGWQMVAGQVAAVLKAPAPPGFGMS